MNVSVRSVFNGLIMDSPCFTSRQMKESSSRGHIKELRRILARTHIKMLKKDRVLISKVRASGGETNKMSP